MITTFKKVMDTAKNAEWFCIAKSEDAIGRDIYLDNEREKILKKYGENTIVKAVGRCASIEDAKELIITIK